MTDTQYYSLLTNSGHQANIKSKALGLPIVISKVAFGSGAIVPTESATKLVKEEIRVNINSIIQSETDKNILEIEAVIPSDVGGFLVNEAALYLEDGTLYAVANLPASYKPSLEQGAGKEFAFTIFLASVGVESVTLKIDDSLVFATRKYVLSELKKYALINGDETKEFKVADATKDNEAINKGQFDSAVVKLINNQTIAGVKTFTSSPIVPTPAPSDNSTKVATTEWNKLGFAISLTPDGYIKLPTWLGGLILQWGTTPNLSGNLTTGVTFPIAFPTKCLQAFSGGGTTATVASGSFSAVTTTGGTFYSNTGSNGQPYRYFAIGY